MAILATLIYCNKCRRRLGSIKYEIIKNICFCCLVSAKDEMDIRQKIMDSINLFMWFYVLWSKQFLPMVSVNVWQLVIGRNYDIHYFIDEVL